MGVNGEALQLHAAYKKQFFIASHVRICISATSDVRFQYIVLYYSHIY